MAEKQLMHIGQRIKDLREQYGLKQKDLAEEVGISIASLSSYEKDISEPSLMTTVKLANALNVSIDFLVNGKPLEKEIESKTGLTSKAVHALKKLNNVDMDYADIVSQLITIQEFRDAITEIGTAKQILIEDGSIPEDVVQIYRPLNIVHKSHGGENKKLQGIYHDLAYFHAHEAKEKMNKAVDRIMREVWD